MNSITRLVIAAVWISTALISCANPPQKSIKLNQLGYLPGASKIAIIPATEAERFDVINSDSGRSVYSGLLSETLTWNEQGTEEFKIANFSELQEPGNYRIHVSSLNPSKIITIGSDIYHNAHRGALKAYYFNRASTELKKEHAGDYARAAGHLDNNVLIHSSAASAKRPAGSTFSAPKGWYDAGDYGKYTVNSGISTYTLLAAYRDNPQLYGELALNIPESANTVPDILDEIMWNLDWLQAMQDPNDGGVYHKLTTLKFDGIIMPAAGTKPRYFIGKGTAASLNFAAVMAAASRVYQGYNKQFPGKAAAYREAALSAWRWANENPNLAYIQPDDVKTGAYGDSKFDDEFAWAAAELYLLTKAPELLARFKSINTPFHTPSWAETGALGYLSLINEGEGLLSNSDYKWVSDALVTHADKLLQRYVQSPYKVVIADKDFVWGSNAVALNNAWMLLEAHQLTPNEAYLNAALGEVDYILGRNPTGYSFITGHGQKTPQNPHHRPSEADTIDAPIPGFIVGGPHAGQQDRCDYPSNKPAKSYTDDWCSYSTNEVTINWNAPLVYVLGSLPQIASLRP